MLNNIIIKNLSTIQNNREIIKQDKKCQQIISELKTIVNFIINFTDLSFDRDFISCKKITLSLHTISTSFEMTAENIVSCCESGCLADANSLLRKYKDDLFFFLYIIVYDVNNKFDNASLMEEEKNIDSWLNNKLEDLSIGNILKSIGKTVQVRDIVKEYNLQTSFNSIQTRLNNYIHSNGIAYYNMPFTVYPKSVFHKQIQKLLNDMRYITITFLFLLTLCSPHFIMSSDYIDYLDCGKTPPDDSQYWVEPFILDFFMKNIDLIDKNCLTYLQKNTCMKI